MALLATNTLVQDCRDVNPVVRGLSLRTLGSMQSPSVVELLTSAVARGLEDNSPYVRRCAALAAASLHKVSPNAVTDGEIWDLLYRHLGDRDGQTVAACLCALEEVFSQEAGVVLSNKLGQYLVGSLHSFPAAVQRVLLQFLLKYSPKSKTQVFDHLNRLDDSLTGSSSLAVTLSCLEVFCHLTADLPKVKAKAYKAAWTAIKKHLPRERNEEIVSALIDYLSLTEFPASVCEQDYRKLFCRDDDPQYLMNRKIGFLCKLIVADNAEDVLSEFAACVRRVSPESVKEMVQNLAQTMRARPEVEKNCAEFLVRLMEMENSRVLDCVVQALPLVVFQDGSHWEAVTSCLTRHFRKLTSPTARVACVEVIGWHGVGLEETPEVLSTILEEWLESPEEADGDEGGQGHSQDLWQGQETFPAFRRHSGSFASGGGDTAAGGGAVVSSRSQQQLQQQQQQKRQLKVALLGAMVRACMSHPARVQPVLCRVMERCARDSDRAVRERALFLHTLLKVTAQRKMAEHAGEGLDL
ncbi:AP-4 complex subunit beta-1 isoform X2 [Aplysia californica]|nr:AP-4 complex subunit beta-1 isoform X2 [Aplysia californica]XP_035829249.1 AP-4 complex subunit beta-1 isoform X2 [Aplysia californica]